MNIQTKKEDNALTIILEGRLDTSTAPQLEECINSSLEGITDLSLDLSSLDYISSAGLRVLLSAQKKMMTKGQMQICGANETVMEIFEITGFSDILTIQ
ncbi:MAG: STAS domain-containing protein [Lachnospiraceae bacterium]|nr:STAS domain-containing protein [Lachnospiraceae bacterium]